MQQAISCQYYDTVEKLAMPVFLFLTSEVDHSEFIWFSSVAYRFESITIFRYKSLGNESRKHFHLPITGISAMNRHYSVPIRSDISVRNV